MMVKGLFIGVLLICAVTGLMIRSNTHLGSDDDDDITPVTIKFSKSDIQDPNNCRNNDEEC